MAGICAALAFLFAFVVLAPRAEVQANIAPAAGSHR